MPEIHYMETLYKVLIVMGGFSGVFTAVFAGIWHLKQKAEDADHAVLKTRLKALEEGQAAVKDQLAAFIESSQKTVLEAALTAQAQAAMKETMDELKDTVHDLGAICQQLAVAVAGMKK